jgi:hypothetical protein
MDVKRPLVFGLNKYKSQLAWSPYYPFTLSIKSNRHLYDFIRGTLFLLVILPQAAVAKSDGRERCGNVGNKIPAGTVERGERKRTAAEVWKAD